ncbi:Qat anti-phage system QueC-like protein QatC [Robinsoniella peoriensis]|uniref:7-cyano-7-deazaguanine synthase n=1 Tax=Robinsoniella peoriensis TaxID=180332 RepID=A0A4U8QCT9_9FIRM|nr:Qat anti-phage system QueC-like protein QatC [Robinsoniella peoriensis]MDU7031058.1 Qat anti-phage system QueC-like protein QatC [Clostridiales bacterium]TLD02133.1 hypothetical protein DSM106044_00939 [Robinsoniella peoriensis]
MKVWINKAEKIDPINEFENAIRFDMLDEGPKSNLKVNFEEIWRRFNNESLDEIYEDLITLAASVYAADKRIPRIGIRAGEVGDNWTREIHISIPVLEFAKWNAVQRKLEDILNFLSGDIWTVNFRKTDSKFRNFATKKKYDFIEGKFDAVSLFSGGLDSYSGAINLLEKGKNICFVGCREYNALGNRIYALHRILKESYPNRRLDMVLFNTDARIPYNIDEDLKTKYIENTSRSRSFLFLSVALAVASQVGEEVPVYIPENGFIGLNIPLTPSRRGSCSTRTTHVYFINALNDLLQILLIPHTIENFFAYKTKGEIVQSVKMTNAFKRGAGNTISCSHPMRADKGIKGRPRNCGYCYPCLIRRSSLNGINVSEEYLEKFKEGYKISMAFAKNERYSNPDTGKTTDLKAVLLAVHNHLKYGSKDYYTQRLIALGGMSMKDIEKFVDVYMKSMSELYDFIKEQAQLNGNELLQFIEEGIDE